jgi:hypothetical protein
VHCLYTKVLELHLTTEVTTAHAECAFVIAPACISLVQNCSVSFNDKINPKKSLIWEAKVQGVMTKAFFRYSCETANALFLGCQKKH